MKTKSEIWQQLEDVKTHPYEEVYEKDAEYSKAVSLKRIADILDSMLEYKRYEK